MTFPKCRRERKFFGSEITCLELNQDECAVQTHNLLVSQKHVLLEAWHLLILKCSVWILWSEETHKISSETKLHARMPRTYATNGCSCQKWGNVHHLLSAETHIACHAGELAVRRDTHVSSLLVLTIARLQPKGRAGQHEICEQLLAFFQQWA